MKGKISILFVDDRLAEIEDLIEIIKEGFVNWPSELELLIYDDPRKAIEAIKNKLIKPDIILVDIEMPQMTGFEFVDLCGYNRLLIPEPYIILISAHDEHQYYKLATDRRLEYIIKGKEADEKLVDKIQQYLNTWSISVYKNGNSRLYPLSDICYFRAKADYTDIIFKNGEVTLVTKSLGEIESSELLLCKGFLRVRESHTINKFSVNSYSTKGRGQFLFEGVLPEDLKMVVIGRKYRENSHEVNCLIEYLKKAKRYNLYL